MIYTVEYWFDYNHRMTEYTFQYETTNYDEDDDQNEHILSENIKFEVHDRMLNFLEDSHGEEALNELGYIQENGLYGFIYYI
jgi:hypothetical protein